MPPCSIAKWSDVNFCPAHRSANIGTRFPYPRPIRIASNSSTVVICVDSVGPLECPTCHLDELVGKCSRSSVCVLLANEETGQRRLVFESPILSIDLYYGFRVIAIFVVVIGSSQSGIERQPQCRSTDGLHRLVDYRAIFGQETDRLAELETGKADVESAVAGLAVVVSI